MADDAQLAKLSRELFIAAAAPSSIPTWATERMASMLEDQELREGDTLFEAGDPPAYVYFMRDGRIRMDRENGAPVLFEGRWFLGGFDALAEVPYRRSAVALSSFSIQRVQADSWLELLEDSFEIARSMISNAVRTLAALEEKFGAAATFSPEAPVLKPRGGAPLSFVERLTLLMDVPALRGAGVQTLADLAAVTDEVAFASGEIVLGDGVPGERAYVVFDGAVAVSRPRSDVPQIYGPGTMVFGPAALGNPAPPLEARAKAPTRAVTFRLEDVMDLMEEHFDLVRSALASLGAERERLLDEKATERGGLVLR